MDLNADIFMADAMAATLRARGAEANATKQREATERLEIQVETLRAQVEGLKMEKQRLQAELDGAMAECAARRAQAKVLLNAATEAGLAAVQGDEPEYVAAFKAAYEEEARARGLPPVNWS